MSNSKDAMIDLIEKDELKKYLRDGIVIVDFLKANGDARTMRCTNNPTLIPEEARPKSSVKQEPHDTNLFKVYDVDVKGWRSFRFERVSYFGPDASAVEAEQTIPTYDHTFGN